MEAPRGFYQPIHWLARLRVSEATMPRPLAWGYRAALCDEDAESANATLPVHLMSDVPGYTLDALNRKRRGELRTSRRRATIVQLVGPGLLREQGFEVKRSAVQRTGYGHAGSRELYLAQLDHYFGSPSQLVLAGIVDGRLGGYLTGTRVHDTAYIDNTIIATDALRARIGTAMVFEFVQACRRGGAREVVRGLHTPEDPSLVSYKEDLGFRVTRVPARVTINRCVAPVVRRRRPHAYYRLTGASAIPLS
jgi:hypothetical protein